MREKQPPDSENFGTDEGGAGPFLLGCAGAAIGIIAGFFLFVTTYKPFTGLGDTPAWQVSLMDGFIITGAGTLAFVFRKKTAFLQGILISAAFLFILNGFCGLGAR